MYKRIMSYGLILVLSVAMALSIASFAAAEVVTIEIMPSKMNVEEKDWYWENVWGPFEAAYPNIKMRLRDTADPETQLRQELAAGAGPDIAIFYGPTSLRQYAASGHLLSLDEYAEEYGWADTVASWAYNSAKHNGVLYGLPDGFEALLAWYNKDMFERNNWKIPTNFEELTALCDQIQAAGIIPFELGTARRPDFNENWTSAAFNAYLGKDELKKVLKGEVPWTSELIKEATEMLVDMWQKGYLNDKQSFAINRDDARALFYAEKTAMNYSGTWEIKKYAHAAPDFEVDFFTMPPWREGVEAPLPLALSKSVGINANSKNPDAAAAYLNWRYATPAVGELLAVQAKYLPLNGLDFSKVEGLPPLVNKAEKVITKMFTEGKTGYASWMYFPTTANVYLYEEIVSVYLGKLTIDEYLEEAQRRAEKDAEKGLLFGFDD